MPRVDKDQHKTNEEANKRKTRAKVIQFLCGNRVYAILTSVSAYKAREMESARVEEKENMKDKNKAKAPTKVFLSFGSHVSHLCPISLAAPMEQDANCKRRRRRRRRP